MPAVVLVALMSQIPLLATLVVSTIRWNLAIPSQQAFIGFGNFATVLNNGIAFTALANTVIMTFSTVILSTVLGVGLAILLNERFVGRRLVRVLILTPFLVTPVAAALVWKTGMLDFHFGLINRIGVLLGFDAQAWVEQFPMGSVIAILVWTWTPFVTVIVLAGLQGLPQDVMEAARVDGAGSWRLFAAITLPSLRPYIELSAFLATVYVLQTFGTIRMLTQGGPGRATMNMPYAVYDIAFVGFNVGQAAALALMAAVLTIIFALFAIRVVTSLVQVSR